MTMCLLTGRTSRARTRPAGAERVLRPVEVVHTRTRASDAAVLM